jgi:hypothetical protein
LVWPRRHLRTGKIGAATGHLFSNDKADAANNGRAVIAIVVFDVEDLPSQAPMGVDAKEGLTQSDEDGKMKNGIRGQLPELDPVEKKKRTKEFVGREREPTKQEGNKHNSKAFRRLWARG